MEELQKEKTKFVVADPELKEDAASPLAAKAEIILAEVQPEKAPEKSAINAGDKQPPEPPPVDTLHKAENIHIYYLSRALASLIDLLPSAILSALALSVFNVSMGGLYNSSQLLNFLWIALPAFEYLAFVPAAGNLTYTTLGKNAFKMKIVRADGSPVDRKQLLFRTIFKYACLYVAAHLGQNFSLSMVLALAIMWHRRFIFEYLSGTRVVFNDEDVQKTFYPRSTIWTTVAIGWLLLCLSMGTTRLYEICSTMGSAFTLSTYGEKSPQYVAALEFEEEHSKRSDPALYPEEVERLEQILVLRNKLGMTKDDGYARALLRRAVLAQVLNDDRAGRYMKMLIDMDSRIVKSAVSAVMGSYSNFDPYRETAKQLVNDHKYTQALDALLIWNAQYGADDNTYDHRDCMEQMVRVLNKLGRFAEAGRVQEQLNWNVTYGNNNLTK